MNTPHFRISERQWLLWGWFLAGVTDQLQGTCFACSGVQFGSPPPSLKKKTLSLVENACNPRVGKWRQGVHWPLSLVRDPVSKRKEGTNQRRCPLLTSAFHMHTNGWVYLYTWMHTHVHIHVHTHNIWVGKMWEKAQRTVGSLELATLARSQWGAERKDSSCSLRERSKQGYCRRVLDPSGGDSPSGR